eukprot:TRINITY_DN232_c0_g1_i2.p1 TRINITY_DN232_c0_g1~~TRINITY_DN232_c0_g1_i2.p1  ORF type:complete len:265 (-),score=53.22 TRINITY_DN232_c0_g1_i2:96-890(-)
MDKEARYEDGFYGNLLILSWHAKAPGTAFVSRGEFRLREAEERGDTDQIKRDEAFFANTAAKGVSFDQLREFVEEVNKSCEMELKNIEISLQKTARWHKIMLMSAGLAAPVVLPKIVNEGHRVQHALFGPAPQLFVSMSAHAVAEAVRQGFTQRGVYVMVKPAVNGSFCLILTLDAPVPSNLRVLNRNGTPYPKHLRSVRLHAHDGSNRLASNHPTSRLQKAHQKRINKMAKKGYITDESREHLIAEEFDEGRLRYQPTTLVRR